METQNVQADAGGHYTVLLGSTKAEGLPAELFASGQARWIGVQVEQEGEQARTLLVSAPYALKAGDAETLGGLPASAFVQVAAGGGGGGGGGRGGEVGGIAGERVGAGRGGWECECGCEWERGVVAGGCADRDGRGCRGKDLGRNDDRGGGEQKWGGRSEEG